MEREVILFNPNNFEQKGRDRAWIKVVRAIQKFSIGFALKQGSREREEEFGITKFARYLA